MVNAVIVHCPGDEDRARLIAGAWRGGRATVCQMEPDRRRVPIGAHSVMIGLWSERSQAGDGGRQMASVLGATEARSLLVVWDGRPPLSLAASAGVPVIVAPEEPAALMDRLHSAAERLEEGKAPAADARKPPDPRARLIGLIAGLVAALAGGVWIALRLAPH